MQAAPDDDDVRAVRAEVNRARVAAETSVMARGIFSWAAHQAEQPVDEGGTEGER